MNKTLFVLLLMVLVSACSMPYKPADVEPKNASFYGIHPNTIQANESNVIMIHGMCDHGRGWVTSNLNEVASQLKMKYVNLTTLSQDNNKVEVYKARLSDSTQNAINFYTIVYSPLTKHIKKEKLWDNDVKPIGIFSPFEKDERKRGRLNRWIKGKMLNDCFADALIYLGSQGHNIRESVRKAIDIIESDINNNSPLFLISESLGSKVLRDALVCNDIKDIQKSEKRLRFVSKTRQVFLFANQLPLLNEGNNFQCPNNEQLIASNSNSTRSDSGIFNLLDTIESYQQSQGLSSRKSPIKVVSFTDPNDILSYEIAPEHYENRDVVNVIVSNAKTYLGLFSNPISAHTKYLFNNDVTKFLKCGKGLQIGSNCK